MKGHTNKIKAISDAGSRRFDRSFSRLPLFENVARVALWGRFSFGSGWWRSGAFVGQNEDLGISFSGVRYKQLVRVAVDFCFSAARLVECVMPIYASWGGERLSRNVVVRGA